MKADVEYIPYGDEWKREMMKWNKDDLIEKMLKPALIKTNEASKEKQMLDFAEQQLTGFAHASRGYSIEELATAMGLKESEWRKLSDKVDLKFSDKRALDMMFNLTA